MGDHWVSALEALGAGAAGGTAIIAFVVWFFRDKFFNWVEQCFDSRGPALKVKVDGWYAADIRRREEWVEEVRRNAHSITGLTDIMTKHEEQLEALQGIPWMLTQQVQLLNEIKKQAEDNRSETVTQGKQLAALIERRNSSRED